MEGLVIKSTGSWYIVRTKDDKDYKCKLKGSFRIKGIRNTNPVAVGDNVKFSLVSEEGSGLINEIYPRNNYIIRKATKLSKRSHIIAANIDQAYLIVTLALPRTSHGFIDRYLITSEAYHVPASIVFNKIDIYDKETNSTLEEYLEIYESAGYPCIKVSALRGDNIDELKKLIKNKITLFSGHSGVGKSALLNRIQPNLNIKTKPISKAHLKGQHTTTFTEMCKLDFGGYIIDTPGIKEFGLIDFSLDEIAERYPEMRKIMHNCKYYNCTHVHEPGCAVKKAMEDGTISRTRYDQYLKIINKEENTINPI